MDLSIPNDVILQTVMYQMCIFLRNTPKNWHKTFGSLMAPKSNISPTKSHQGSTTNHTKAPLQPPVNPLWMSLRTLSSTHLLLTFRSSSYGPTCKSWGPTSLRVWPLKTTPEACNFRETLSRWDLMETILPQENLPFLDAFEAWNSLVNVKVQKVLY